MNRATELKGASSAWEIRRGRGPIVASAIHNGHQLRPEIERLLRLSEDVRFREEDPFTDLWTAIVTQRIIVNQSRFEFDLNRTPESCVYDTPEDAWGLDLYYQHLPEDMRDRSFARYEAFFKDVHQYFSELQNQYGHFVVLDLHSYNHMRDGPNAPQADPAGNPEINIGTGTVTCRKQWEGLIDQFIADLRAFDFAGRHLDVRENVKFVGRNFGQWTHSNFEGTALCFSIEVKKFFMDEWTAELDQQQHQLIFQALRSTLPGLLDGLEGIDYGHKTPRRA